MLSDGFVLGLIAGEGSFHVVLESPSRQRPKFTMNMHEESILEMACEHIGVGAVTRPNNGVRADWQVQSKDDIQKMREWVDENMCGSFKATDKYRQFKLWSEAVDIVPDGREPIGQSERERLIEIAYEIPKSDTRSKSKSSWIEDVQDKQVYFCGGENNDGTECSNRVPSENATCRWH